MNLEIIKIALKKIPIGMINGKWCTVVSIELKINNSNTHACRRNQPLFILQIQE